MIIILIIINVIIIIITWSSLPVDFQKVAFWHRVVPEEFDWMLIKEMRSSHAFVSEIAFK